MVKFIWQDALLFLSILFNLGARALTIFLTTSVSTITTSANALELNPVARLLGYNEFAQFAFGIISLGLIITCYWYIRRSALKDKTQNERWLLALTLVVFIIFIGTIADMTNDLAVVIGYLYGQ